MSNAPIALFVYNRLEHTRQTIDALKKNYLAGDSDLIIFSDGYENEESKNKVEEVRKYLKTIVGFKSIQIIERSENWGLAKSIINGVTEVVSKYGKIIVLEDDLVTSQYFLKYMNDALDMYVDEEKVISIHGYLYPVKESLPETFFLRGAECWGWATWKRGWNLFETDGKKLLSQLREKKLTKYFDYNGGYPFTQMLSLQIAGLNNSWAIRWYASAFFAEKLTLYPRFSLVKNIGFDNTGRHSGKIDWFSSDLYECPVNVKNIEISELFQNRKKIEKYFKTPKIRLLTTVMSVRGMFKLIKKKLYK